MSSSSAPDKESSTVNSSNPSNTTKVDDSIDIHTTTMQRNRNAFNTLKASVGLSHQITLKVGFELVDNYIGLYLLNDAENTLNELFPVVMETNGPYKPRAIQASAFILFKQQRFREAVGRFNEFETIEGKSSTLAENKGHCYNAIGDYVNAEK